MGVWTISRLRSRRVACDGVLQCRFPAGPTTDEVLAALSELGRVHVDVTDGDPAPRYCCRLTTPGQPEDATIGEGLTLTAAALRCLLEAEDDVSLSVRRGLDAIDCLLGGY